MRINLRVYGSIDVGGEKKISFREEGAITIASMALSLFLDITLSAIFQGGK